MPKVVPRPLPVGSSPGRAPPVRPAPSAAGPPLPVGSPQGRPPRIRPTPSASSSYARASTHRGCRLQLAPLWVRLDARRHCRNHGFPSCRRRSRRRVHAGVRREVCGTGRRCKVGRVRKGRVLEPRRLCQESRACNNPRCHRTQQQCRPLVRRCSHEIARGTRAEEVSRYSGSISPYRTGRGFAGFLRAQTLLICRWGFLFPHNHVRSGVLVSTNRLFALVTASQIASASASSFFCRFTYGLLAWFRDGARRSFSLQASPAGSFLFLCVPCAGRRRARFNPATGTAAGRDYGWTLLGNRIIFRS